METHSNAYKEPEVEFSLRGIFWDLLEQWKMVLIVALLFAISIPALKYQRDNKQYQSSLTQAQEQQRQQEKQTSPSTDMEIEQALSSLSSSEKPAVETLLRLHELVDSQSQYLNESLLLNTDPAHQHTLQLNYLITSKEGAETLPLAAAYKAQLLTDDVIRKIGNVIDSTADPTTIGELCTVSYEVAAGSSARQILTSVNIVLPSEGIDINSLAGIVDSAVSETSGNLMGTIGEHSIAPVSKREAYLYNDIAINRKQSLVQNITYNRSTIKSEANALTASQKAAYEKVLSARDAKTREEEGGLEATAGKDAQASNPSNDNPSGIINPPSFSVRFAAAGFIVGTALYALAYTIFVIARKRVGSEEVLADYTGTRLLSGLYYPTTHSGLSKLFHSSFVSKRRYAGKGPVEEQISTATFTIESVCEHALVKDVCLLNSGKPSDGFMRIIDTMITGLSSRGIHVQVMNVDATADERSLLPIKNAIFLANSDTKASDVWKAVSLARSYDIVQLGCVYMREY